MRRCPRCKTSKHPKEFVRNSSYCRSCRSEYGKAYYRANRDSLARRQYVRRQGDERQGEYQRRRRQENQAYINDLKSAPCTDCGRGYPPYVMDFDHVRGAKHKRLAQLTGGSRQAIDAEIAKCELVCSNCHRIRTHTRLESPASGGNGSNIVVEESPDTPGQATGS